MSNIKTAILLAGTISLVACGGMESGADAAVAPKGYGVPVMSEHEKASLSALEQKAFESVEDKHCDPAASPYMAEVGLAVDQLNAHIRELDYNQPVINQVLLFSAPPRLEDTVAIFLCDGFDFNASTLYRSIFLSNRFLEELKGASAEWEDESLFQPAVSYVIFHEFAHAALNHSAAKLSTDERGGPVFDLPQEVEADRFAYYLMMLADQDLTGIMVAQSLDGN